MPSPPSLCIVLSIFSLIAKRKPAQRNHVLKGAAARTCTEKPENKRSQHYPVATACTDNSAHRRTDPARNASLHRETTPQKTPPLEPAQRNQRMSEWERDMLLSHHPLNEGSGLQSLFLWFLCAGSSGGAFWDAVSLVSQCRLAFRARKNGKQNTGKRKNEKRNTEKRKTKNEKHEELILPGSRVFFIVKKVCRDCLWTRRLTRTLVPD